MRFLILNTDYPEFLKQFYMQNPGLEDLSYEEQLQSRYQSLFGVADFYSRNLQKLGHEAWEIYANNECLQRTWMEQFSAKASRLRSIKETGSQILLGARRLAPRTPLKYLKTFFRPLTKNIDQQAAAWFYEILANQITFYAPDVLINQDMVEISPDFLKTIKQKVRLLVGQTATPIPERDYSCYDLIISSFPPILSYFKKKKIPAERHLLGFEKTILNLMPEFQRDYDLTFAGNLFPGFHRSRLELLEFLCTLFSQLSIWAPSIEHVLANSPIRKCYKGQAWGRDVYQILQRSRITLNQHGDVHHFANNMRLYEATGMGAMLITDWKEDLHTLFEPEKEVVTYRSAEDCALRIDYYLNHCDERATIASAGQKKTLAHHSYFQRMQQLIDIVNKYI